MPHGDPHDYADILMRPPIGFKGTEPKLLSDTTDFHFNETSSQLRAVP